MFSKQAARSQDPFQAQQYHQRAGYIAPNGSDKRLEEHEREGKRSGKCSGGGSPSLWQCKQT